LAASAASADVLAEKRKLKKSLFRFDLIFFTVCAILAIDTIGQSASYGSQAIFWLVVSAATFLIPYGLLTSELGTTFPVEGGPYEWVRLAFGHMAGAITAVLYWLSNPIWLGGTLAATAIAAMDALWGTKIADNTGLSILVGLAFIWVAVTMNILSLRSMKWVPNLGAIVKIGLFALFAVLVLVSGTQHGFAGSLGGMFDGLGVAFVGVIGVLVFQWVGFELTTNASEEMENPQRDVPRSVAFSGVISVISYAIPIAGIVLLLGSKDLSNVSSFATAYQTAVGNALGSTAQNIINGIVGAGIVFALLASGVVWLMGSVELMVKLPLFTAISSRTVALLSLIETKFPLAELTPSEPKLLPELFNAILPLAPTPVELNEASPPAVIVLPDTWPIAPPELMVREPLLTEIVSSAVSFASVT